MRFTPESSEPLWVRRKGIRQHLQGIVALERSVMRSPDLAHPAFTDKGGDFIGAEPRAGEYGHPGRCPFMATWP